jgi:hypothetical protein
LRAKKGVLFVMYLRIVMCVLLSISVSVQAETNEKLLQLIVNLKVELAQKNKDIERRLVRLEQLMGPEYSVQVVPSQSTTTSPAPPVTLQAVVPKWQRQEAWAHIKPGMNRADVEDFLGRPNSEKVNIVGYTTLSYEGSQVSGKRIKGSVTLTDSDRVEYRGINVPEW